MIILRQTPWQGALPLHPNEAWPAHGPRPKLVNTPQPLFPIPMPDMASAFKFVAPSLWNALPESIKATDSIDMFRANLKTHFFLSENFLFMTECLTWIVCVCAVCFYFIF